MVIIIISSCMYGLGSNETSIPIIQHIININVISILFLSSFTAWFPFVWYVYVVGSLCWVLSQSIIETTQYRQRIK